MTNEQATAIRYYFRSEDGYAEVVKYFPNLHRALDALPDEDPMSRVNTIFQEMFQDAKRYAGCDSSPQPAVASYPKAE